MLFPIVVLAFCYTHFTFDRALVLLNMKVLPVGSFDTHARALTDPAEIALFRVNFDMIRIETVTQLVLHVGMNLSFCYRFKRVVEVVIEASIQVPPSAKDSREAAHRHQRSAPRPIALLFQAFAVAVIVFVHQAIETSKTSCAAYPECVVFAYRWTSQSSSCPCIALIDANRAPLRYSQWIDAPDAVNSVKELAVAGYLRLLMLINRKFVEWPEEMLQSVNLQHMYVAWDGISTHFA